MQGNERIIELGCGDGKLSEQIAPLIPNGHLTCIDIDAHKIASAKNRLKDYRNVDIIHEDITKLPKPVQPYDLVVAQMVLHDITPQKRVETIDSLTNWLNEGSVLVIREPLECINFDELKQHLTSSGFTDFNQVTVNIPFTVNFYHSRKIQELRCVYRQH